MSETIKVHSIESLGALDGPGLRTVIFLSGCPLKCQYCHNPDTWSMTSGHDMTVEDLIHVIMKYKPYYAQKGGVTLSGGDPLLQAKALIPLVKALKEADIHVALDTSGALWNDAIERLIHLVDLILLDVKHTEALVYHTLTGGNLDDTTFFLSQLIRHEKPYWIRQVIIPTINNTPEQLLYLEEITRSPYRQRMELLPFHKSAAHKWEKLNRHFPLAHLPETSENDLKELLDKAKLPFNAVVI
ncbi:MAG: pyruvate formate lyase-activating protein [Clostridia bacterium]|nr:pyruvate formate lyase-activating protein [Clostridia bacterium]